MKYEVEIVDKPYILQYKSKARALQIETPQTAIVTFLNDDGSTDKVLNYGYKTSDEIYLQLENDKRLDLDNCYVCSLDFQDAEIQTIHARNAFFNDYIRFRKATFKDEVCFQNTIFVGKADFRGTEFCADINFIETVFYEEANFQQCKFESNITFKNSMFHVKAIYFCASFYGRADFSNAYFGDRADFHRVTSDAYVDFSGAKFKGMASFYESLFKDGFDFKQASVKGIADFQRSMFADYINFYDAEFCGEALFGKTKFTKDVAFSNAKFKNYVTFEDVEFSKAVRFTEIEFGDMTSFHAVQFYDDAIFIRCIFREYTFFSQSSFFMMTKFISSSVKKSISFRYAIFYSHTSFEFKECEELELSDCVFDKSFTASSEVRINSLAVINCKNVGLFSIPFDDIQRNAITKYKSDSFLEDIDYHDYAKEYNYLKVNYNHNGEYDYEDQAYLEYRRCLRETKQPIIRKLEWFLLDFISCYCTKPFRVLAVALVMIFLFAGIFYLSTVLPFVSDAITFSPNMVIQISDSATSAPEIITQTTSNYEGIGGCFYHSLITFFTIGYGDSRPLGLLGLILTGLEGFIGVFLMSLFTVSFVRKALR
ncbi:MAG: ion channel [Eubacteriales bacterium]|nr:ion channel [Eubacteriales bacterium]